MKRFLHIIALTVFCAFSCSTSLHAQLWGACNTAGKSVPVRVDAGDVVTLPLPGLKSHPTYVAFLTKPTGSLAGKTITATFRIDSTANVAYGVGYGAGPATMRLYFTTASGNFSLNDSNNHTLNYWWCWASSTTVENVDGGLTVTIAASVAPGGGWSAAHGEQSSINATAFSAAAANAKTVGFAFAGSQFYDTGIDCKSGAATFHLAKFDF